MTLKRLCFLSHITVLREVGDSNSALYGDLKNLSFLHPITPWFLVPWSNASHQHVDIGVSAYELKRGKMSCLMWRDHLELILPLPSPWSTLGPRDACPTSVLLLCMRKEENGFLWTSSTLPAVVLGPLT